MNKQIFSPSNSNLTSITRKIQNPTPENSIIMPNFPKINLCETNWQQVDANILSSRIASASVSNEVNNSAELMPPPPPLLKARPSSSKLKDEIVYFTWTPYMNKNLQMAIKGKTKNGYIHGRSITNRLSNLELLDKTNRLQKLQGPMEVVNQADIPSYILENFQNGFPIHWQRMALVWADYIRMDKPKDFRWPRPISDLNEDFPDNHQDTDDSDSAISSISFHSTLAPDDADNDDDEDNAIINNQTYDLNEKSNQAQVKILSNILIKEKNNSIENSLSQNHLNCTYDLIMGKTMQQVVEQNLNKNKLINKSPRKNNFSLPGVEEKNSFSQNQKLQHNSNNSIEKIVKNRRETIFVQPSENVINNFTPDELKNRILENKKSHSLNSFIEKTVRHQKESNNLVEKLMAIGQEEDDDYTTLQPQSKNYLIETTQNQLKTLVENTVHKVQNKRLYSASCCGNDNESKDKSYKRRKITEKLEQFFENLTQRLTQLKDDMMEILLSEDDGDDSNKIETETDQMLQISKTPPKQIINEIDFNSTQTVPILIEDEPKTPSKTNEVQNIENYEYMEAKSLPKTPTSPQIEVPSSPEFMGIPNKKYTLGNLTTKKYKIRKKMKHSYRVNQNLSCKKINDQNCSNISFVSKVNDTGNLKYQKPNQTCSFEPKTNHLGNFTNQKIDKNYSNISLGSEMNQEIEEIRSNISFQCKTSHLGNLKNKKIDENYSSVSFKPSIHDAAERENINKQGTTKKQESIFDSESEEEADNHREKTITNINKIFEEKFKVTPILLPFKNKFMISTTTEKETQKPTSTTDSGIMDVPVPSSSKVGDNISKILIESDQDENLDHLTISSDDDDIFLFSKTSHQNNETSKGNLENNSKSTTRKTEQNNFNNIVEKVVKPLKEVALQVSKRGRIRCAPLNFWEGETLENIVKKIENNDQIQQELNQMKRKETNRKPPSRKSRKKSNLKKSVNTLHPAVTAEDLVSSLNTRRRMHSTTRIGDGSAIGRVKLFDRTEEEKLQKEYIVQFVEEDVNSSILTHFTDL